MKEICRKCKLTNLETSEIVYICNKSCWVLREKAKKEDK